MNRTTLTSPFALTAVALSLWCGAPLAAGCMQSSRAPESRGLDVPRPAGPVSAEDRSALYDSLQNEPRENQVVRVVRAVTPSVVFIQTEAYQQVRGPFGTQDRVVSGAGTGVIVHPLGYVVTNYHVVEGARTVTVSFDGDPGRYRAQIVSFVREEDLALLRIIDVPESLRSNRGAVAASHQAEVPAEFPTVRWGTSYDLMPGESVIAIGNPHGQTYTVSTGIISGLHRDIDVQQRGLHFSGLIQTDASINRGNSGGPLLNIRGELIGINSAMNEAAENMGFAIPVDRVRQVLTDALFPQARASWLGFKVGEGDSLRVARVVSDGPAEAAGICEGDQVVAIDGVDMKNAEDFLMGSLQVSPGARARITVRRGRDLLQRELLAWEPLDGLLFERLGATVDEYVVAGRKYVRVVRVREGGPAHQIGMLPGDLLPALRPELQGQRGGAAYRIQDRAVLAGIVDRLEEGTFIEFDVRRDNGQRMYELLNGRLKLR